MLVFSVIMSQRGNEGNGKPSDPRRKSWSASSNVEHQPFEGPISIENVHINESGPFGNVVQDLSNVSLIY